MDSGDDGHASPQQPASGSSGENVVTVPKAPSEGRTRLTCAMGRVGVGRGPACSSKVSILPGRTQKGL